MPIHDMVARRRQLRRAGHEIDVHPCMHAQPRGMCPRDRRSERIEARLSGQRGRTRLEAAGVVRIGAAAHLDEQRVESAVTRCCHHGVDGCRRSERRSHDPQRAHFIVCPYDGTKYGKRGQDRDDRQDR